MSCSHVEDAKKRGGHCILELEEIMSTPGAVFGGPVESSKRVSLAERLQRGIKKKGQRRAGSTREPEAAPPEPELACPPRG